MTTQDLIDDLRQRIESALEHVKAWPVIESDIEIAGMHLKYALERGRELYFRLKQERRAKAEEERARGAAAEGEPGPPDPPSPSPSNPTPPVVRSSALASTSTDGRSLAGSSAAASHELRTGEAQLRLPEPEESAALEKKAVPGSR